MLVCLTHAIDIGVVVVATINLVEDKAILQAINMAMGELLNVL